MSVSRSIFALVDDRDRAYFGRGNQDQDKVGYIDAQTKAIFGRSYAAEPDVLAKELAEDTAIDAADTLLLTVPNQLGVEYNAHAIESILKYVAPHWLALAVPWRPRAQGVITGDGRLVCCPGTSGSGSRKRRAAPGAWSAPGRPLQKGAFEVSAAERPTGVTIMAAVAAIVSFTDILTGLGDIGIAGGFLSDHGFGDRLDSAMTVVGVVLIAVGALGLATGYGLLRQRNWAWLITRLWASVCIVTGLVGAVLPLLGRHAHEFRSSAPSSARRARRSSQPWSSRTSTSRA